MKIPLEIVDIIAANVKDRFDLFSLSLTCRALYALVRGGHLSYREVNLYDDSPYWLHLKKYPSRSKNVRKVTIQLSEGTYRIAEGSRPTYVDAILLMDSIDHLEVTSSISSTSPKDVLNNIDASWNLIWKHLYNCGSLRDLTISLRNTSLGSDLALRELKSLRKLDISFVRVALSNSSQISLNNFITDNSQIEELFIKIHYSTQLDLTLLFTSAQFPKLRVFCLDANLTSPEEIASAFFDRHPTIEVLQWAGNPSTLSCNLPNLNQLLLPSHTLSVVMFHLFPFMHALYSISWVHVNFSFWEDVFPLINPNALRKIKISRFSNISDIHRIAKEFPNLTWLRLDLSEKVWDNSQSRSRYLKRAELADILPEFTALRVLCGVSLLDRDDTTDEKDEKIQFLASILPHLQYLDHWESSEDYPVMIKIIREEGLVSWKKVHRGFPADLEGPDQDWYRFFSSSDELERSHIVLQSRFMPFISIYV